MTKSELIDTSFLAESEVLTACVLTCEEIHIERLAAVHRYQKLVTLRCQVQTIDNDIKRACVHVVVVERDLQKAERQRLDALSRCNAADPGRAAQ